MGGAKGGARGLGILALAGAAMPSVAKVWDMDSVLAARPALYKAGAAGAAAAVEATVARMRPGDALRLPSLAPLGTVTLDRAPEDIEVSGGHGGTVRVTGTLRGWKFLHCGAGTGFRAEAGSRLDGCAFFCSFGGGDFVDLSRGSHYAAVGLGLRPAAPDPLAKAGAGAGTDSAPADGDVPPKQGMKTYYFADYGNKEIWMPVYYVTGSGSTQPTTDAQVEIRGGDGGKWLFAIEADQGAQGTVFRMIDSRDMEVYSGSTEGNNNAIGPVYDLQNCTRCVLGLRRFYSNHRPGDPWYGAPQYGLRVTGGNGNILHAVADWGNPKLKSLLSDDAGLQIWQSYFEDSIQIAPSSFQFACTPVAMRPQVATKTYPIQVGAEVILAAGGRDLTGAAAPGLPEPPAFRRQPWAQSSAKVTAAGAATRSSADLGLERRYRQASGFGAALLAAGADPTGRAYSDAAFAQVLATAGTVELPPGRFRLRAPLRLRALARPLAKGGIGQVTGPQALLGSGRGRTVLAADPGVAVVLDLRPRALAKAAPATGDFALVEGLSIEGGQVGLALPAGQTSVVADFAIRGAGKAGVVVGAAGDSVDAWFAMPAAEGVTCGTDHWCNDVHLFHDGEVIGHDYGIYYAGFADKQGIRRVRFSGQGKGGISARYTNLFHGWVDYCSFTNINGPAFDISGGKIVGVLTGGVAAADYDNRYYAQYLTMLDSCVVTECGSADRAALDFGYSYNTMLCNSAIAGKKPVRYGFLGSLAGMSHVTVDVNATAAALALRHPRATETSMTPASILDHVTCPGAVLLVDGVPKGDTTEGLPSADPFKDHVLWSKMAGDWDGTNFDGPRWWKQGQYAWPYPRLFRACDLAGAHYGYVLTSGAGYSKELTTGADFPLDHVSLVSDLQPSRLARGAAAKAEGRGPAEYGLDGRRLAPGETQGKMVIRKGPDGVRKEARVR